MKSLRRWLRKRQEAKLRGFLVHLANLKEEIDYAEQYTLRQIYKIQQCDYTHTLKGRRGY